LIVVHFRFLVCATLLLRIGHALLGDVARRDMLFRVGDLARDGAHGQPAV
jgi:hypothetical protein